MHFDVVPTPSLRNSLFPSSRVDQQRRTQTFQGSGMDVQRLAAGNSGTSGAKADAFAAFLEAQLKELCSRLTGEYKRLTQRLEAKVQEMEEASGQARRKVATLEGRSDKAASEEGISRAPVEKRPARQEKQSSEAWKVSYTSEGSDKEISAGAQVWPAAVSQQNWGSSEEAAEKPAVGAEKTGQTTSTERDASVCSKSSMFKALCMEPQSSQKVEEVSRPQGGQGSSSSGGTAFQVLHAWVCNEENENRSSGASGTFNHKASQLFDSDDGFLEEKATWELVLEPFMMQPSSSFYFGWELVGLFLVVRDIFAIPLEILDASVTMFSIVLTWLGRVFWTCDICVSFLIGFVSTQGMVEMRPLRVARQYARTRLLFDLLIVVCDWSELVVTRDAGWRFLAMLRAIRLARLARLVRNQKKVFEFTIRSEWLMLLASLQAYLLLLLCLIHVMTCVWYGVQASTTSDMSDYAGTDRAPLAGTMPERYLFCFHVMLGLFLADEGVSMPRNLLERAVTVVVLFTAFVANAWFVGSLTTAMTRLQIIASQRSAQFAALSNFLADYGISRELAMRVQRNARHALDEQKRNTPESSVALLSLISDRLRAEIHYEVHSKDLCVHPFFQLYNDASPLCLRLVCHSAISGLFLSRGDVLFSEFEVPPIPQMFILLSGKLSYAQCLGGISEVGPKSWISEALLWTTWVHRGLAQATAECRLQVLNAPRFADIVGMYRSPKRYAFKYAGRFVQMLNRAEESELTDLGDPDLGFVLANEVFQEEDRDQLCTGNIRSTIRGSRRSIRRGNLDTQQAFESVMSSLHFKRRSTAVMPCMVSVSE